MGDHDDCKLLARLRQLVDRLLDFDLTLGVQGRSGLVKNEDPGVLDQGSSDRNPLLLAS